MSGSLHSSGQPGSDHSGHCSGASSHERYGEEDASAHTAPLNVASSMSTAADASRLPPQKAPAPGRPTPPPPAEVPSLLARLAAAQQQLQHPDPSEVGETETLDSEERDNALLAQQIEDQLERHSSSASGCSSNNKKDLMRRLHGTGQPRRRQRRGIRSSSSMETSSQSTLSTARLQSMVNKFSAGPVGLGGGVAAEDRGNSHKSKEELLLVLQGLEAENARLQSAKGQADTKHVADVASLQKLLDASKLRDTQNYEELALLTAKVANLTAAHASEVEDLGRKLATSRLATDTAESQLDDMADKMAGRDAVQLHKVRKLEEMLMAEKADREQSDERAEETKQGRQAFWESEVKSLEKQLAKSKDDAKVSAAERDVLRRQANNSANDSKELLRLQGQLNIANAEIKRRDEQGRHAPSGWRDAQRRQDRETFKDLRDQFAESQTKEAALTKELGEMKLLMQRQSEGHETNRRDLQGQLDAANLKLNDKSNAYFKTVGMVTPTSLGRSVGFVKGPAVSHTLDAIEEEENFSQDASMAASFDVSSTGGDPLEVGNMHDFEDTAIQAKEHDLKVLQAEWAEDRKKMAEDKLEMQEMKSEMVGAEALNASKVARLLKQLSAKKAGALEQDEEIARLKQSLIGDGSRHTEEIAMLRKLLAAANTKDGLQADNIKQLEDTIAANDKQKEQDDIDYDKLVEDLYMAQAARDSAERRAEDLKLAMEAREAQHKQEIERLVSQMSTFYTNHTDGGGEAGNAAAVAAAAAAGRGMENSVSLAEQVESLVEEKNLLQNELEWKEVQWRNRAEELQQELVVQAAEFAKEVEGRKAQLGQEIANLKTRVEELIKERDELLVRVRSLAG